MTEVLLRIWSDHSVSTVCGSRCGLGVVSAARPPGAPLLASGELVAAMSWRVVYSTLKAQGAKVAYMNPPGGMFTYVCGLVMHKDAKNYDKALALIDSALSDEAAHYTIDHIGDGPANFQELQKLTASLNLKLKV